MPKVKGRTIVSPTTEPKPGSAPMTMPRNVPARMATATSTEASSARISISIVVVASPHESGDAPARTVGAAATSGLGS